MRRCNDRTLTTRPYWNGRALRTGQGRKRTPAELLGGKGPTTAGCKLLQLSQEHLRQQLSAPEGAACESPRLPGEIYTRSANAVSTCKRDANRPYLEDNRWRNCLQVGCKRSGNRR